MAEWPCCHDPLRFSPASLRFVPPPQNIPLHFGFLHFGQRLPAYKRKNFTKCWEIFSQKNSRAITLQVLVVSWRVAIHNRWLDIVTSDGGCLTCGHPSFFLTPLCLNVCYARTRKDQVLCNIFEKTDAYVLVVYRRMPSIVRSLKRLLTTSDPPKASK